MPLSLAKKLAFTCLVLLGTLVAMDVAARVVYAWRVGPSLLAYGLRPARKQVNTFGLVARQ